MRFVSAVHLLALALLAGGLAGVFIAVSTLFQNAPTREIAGQVGNAIFGRVALLALPLALIVLGTSLWLHRRTPASASRTLSLVLSVVSALAVGTAALYLTPRMSAIWTASPHAADGSGLMPAERSRFLTLHILGNLSYLTALVSGIALILLRSLSRRGDGR